MLSLQHSHGYSGSFLNYITMDNRFLDLIERSIKEHWDLPAFSDYNGHTFHFKDVARRIEKFHILLEHAGIKKGDKVAIVGRNSSNWAICFSEYWLTELLPCRSCMSSNPTISITSSTIREQKPYWQAPATGRT